MTKHENTHLIACLFTANPLLYICNSHLFIQALGISLFTCLERRGHVDLNEFSSSEPAHHHINNTGGLDGVPYHLGVVPVPSTSRYLRHGPPKKRTILGYQHYPSKINTEYFSVPETLSRTGTRTLTVFERRTQTPTHAEYQTYVMTLEESG